MIRTCTETIPRTNPFAARVALEETEENRAVVLPGTPLGNLNEHLQAAGVIVTGKKWENGRTLKVGFLGGDPKVKRRVADVADEWSDHANILFSFVDSPASADVRIAFDPKGGSWSYIGTDALTIPRGEPTMSYGWLTPDSAQTEYKRVVLHEFGHALGMPHEHQHPKGGIPWDRAAVYRYYRGAPNYWDDETIEQNVFARYSESQTMFSEFDPKSIMLYAIPNELTVGDFQVGWNTELSETDKKFIGWQYPKAQEPPSPPTKPVSDAITVTRLLKRGVAEETNVTRDGKPWITARPWNGS